MSWEGYADSEVLARGYNPSYYGDVAPIAGSSRMYKSRRFTPNRDYPLGCKASFGSKSKSYADPETSIADLRTAPDQRDVGHRVEGANTPPLGTPMGTRYRQYKLDDEDAYEAEQEYKRRLKDVPKAPKRKRRIGTYNGESLSEQILSVVDQSTS